jgi:flagellar hook-length control protein FliK
MMIGAIAPSAPAVPGTDDRASRGNNPAETDTFSALLFLILGLAPVQNVTPESVTPEGDSQEGSIGAQSLSAGPQDEGNALVQKSNATVQGTAFVDTSLGLPGSILAGAAEPNAVTVDPTIQSVTSSAYDVPARGEATAGVFDANTTAGPSKEPLPGAAMSQARIAALSPDAQTDSLSVVTPATYGSKDETSAKVSDKASAGPTLEIGTRAGVDVVSAVGQPDGAEQTNPASVFAGRRSSGDGHQDDRQSGGSAPASNPGSFPGSDTRSPSFNTAVTDAKTQQASLQSGPEGTAQKIVETKIPNDNHEHRWQLESLTAVGPNTNVAPAQPPSELEAHRPVAAAPVLEQVAGGIATNVRENRHEAVLTLNPPELGRVKISMSLDGGKLEVHIIAEAHESRTLLQNHIPELKQALQTHQVDLAEVRFDSTNWNGTMGDLNHGFEHAPGHWQQSGSAAGDSGQMTSERSEPDLNSESAAGTGRVSMWA